MAECVFITGQSEPWPRTVQLDYTSIILLKVKGSCSALVEPGRAICWLTQGRLWGIIRSSRCRGKPPLFYILRFGFILPLSTGIKLRISVVWQTLCRRYGLLFRRSLLPTSSVQKSRYLTLVVTLLTCTQEAKWFCLGWHTGCPEVCRGSSQSMKENAGIISYNRPQRLRSTPFQSYFLLIVPAFDSGVLGC